MRSNANDIINNLGSVAGSTTIDDNFKDDFSEQQPSTVTNHNAVKNFSIDLPTGTCLLESLRYPGYYLSASSMQAKAELQLRKYLGHQLQENLCVWKFHSNGTIQFNATDNLFMQVGPQGTHALYNTST